MTFKPPFWPSEYPQKRGFKGEMGPLGPSLRRVPRGWLRYSPLPHLREASRALPGPQKGSKRVQRDPFGGLRPARRAASVRDKHKLPLTRARSALRAGVATRRPTRA